MGGPSYPPSRALRSSFTMSGSAPAYIYACEILPSLFTYIQANCILATLPYKFVLTLSNLCHIPSAVYSGFIRNELLINNGEAIPCKHASSGIRTGALSERLFEFGARFTPLGHHGQLRILFDYIQILND